MAEDLDAAAVFGPGDHPLEPADITVAGRLPDVDGKAHHQDLVAPGGQGLPGANRDALGIGLVVERDLLGEVAAERTEAIGEGLDAVAAGLGIGEHPEQPREGRERLVSHDAEAAGADRAAVGEERLAPLVGLAESGASRPSDSRLRRRCQGNCSGMSGIESPLDTMIILRYGYPCKAVSDRISCLP